MDNNDNNNNSDDDQQQILIEEQTAAKKRRRVKSISILEKTDEFSFRTRNKIDELVGEFLYKIRNDIHDMLCSDLDNNRDMEEEIEAAARLFPDVLSRKEGSWEDVDGEEEWVGGHYPILYLARELTVGCNVEAVSFIPLLVRLAIEFGLLFDGEEERGGLLCQDDIGNNVLQNLMLIDSTKRNNPEHHDPIDDIYLQVLVQLRKMGFLKKEDIQMYGLLNELCSQHYHFAEKRFRFLVEWDPSALTQTYEGHKSVPLYHAVDSSIRGFQLVFEAGIKYFPRKKGINLLFHKKGYRLTPLQYCVIFGHEKVMEIVEGTLARYSDTPANAVEALLSAAIDENVHLDCAYFLLRRQPDVLQQLLSSTPAAAESNNNNSKTDDDSDEVNDVSTNVLATSRMLNSSKKRKREL
jgi:hypothetical protein